MSGASKSLRAPVDALSRGGSAVSPAGVFRVSYRTGVVCADEMMLHSDPYPDRESWCDVRAEGIRASAFRTRLRREDGARWPLVHQPTDALWFREFARWCGTTRTADWHTRLVASRGRSSGHGPHEPLRRRPFRGEVSLGYPIEWSKRARPPVAPKKVLPA
jgi:hypothetical protein